VGEAARRPGGVEHKPVHPVKYVDLADEIVGECEAEDAMSDDMCLSDVRSETDHRAAVSHGWISELAFHVARRTVPPKRKPVGAVAPTGLPTATARRRLRERRFVRGDVGPVLGRVLKKLPKLGKHP